MRAGPPHRSRANVGREEGTAASVPLALHAFARVVGELRVQEVEEARVGGDDLFSRRPAVVGEVEAPASFEGAVDDPAEVLARLGDAGGVVPDVQVEDDAGAVSVRPRQERLVVSSDRPYGAVDELDVVRPEVVAACRHEVGERRARQRHLVIISLADAPHRSW
jgi:hypothetical protein